MLLSKGIAEFYKLNSQTSNFLHDFTIKSSIPEKTQVVNCHRIILASQSPYFVAFFKKHASTQSLELEFSFKSLNSCIEYMYTGETEVNNENFEELIEVASYLQIESFISSLSVFISKQMDFNNCIDLLEFTEKLNLIKIQQKCVAFIAEQISDILLCHGDRIYQLPAHLFAQIVYSNHFVLRTPWGIPYGADVMTVKKNEISNKYYIRNAVICGADIHPNWKQSSSLEWKEVDIAMIATADDVQSSLSPDAFESIPSFVVDLVSVGVSRIEVHCGDWDMSEVVRGLKFIYCNGDVICCGLIDSEGPLVYEIDIEADEHISSVFGAAGWYMDRFGVRTSKGVVHGPYGGQGGSSFDTRHTTRKDWLGDEDSYDLYGTDFVYPSHLQPYVSCISGKVVNSAGVDYIAHIQFSKRFAICQQINEDGGYKEISLTAVR